MSDIIARFQFKPSRLPRLMERRRAKSSPAQLAYFAHRRRDKGRSLRAIAAELGVSRGRVRRSLPARLHPDDRLKWGLQLRRNINQLLYDPGLGGEP